MLAYMYVFGLLSSNLTLTFTSRAMPESDKIVGGNFIIPHLLMTCKDVAVLEGCSLSTARRRIKKMNSFILNFDESLIHLAASKILLVDYININHYGYNVVAIKSIIAKLKKVNTELDDLIVVK